MSEVSSFRPEVTYTLQVINVDLVGNRKIGATVAFHGRRIRVPTLTVFVISQRVASLRVRF